ncbi:hypothetical protein AAMO2058_001314400 [Amorphochlora amoebiformis]
MVGVRLILAWLSWGICYAVNKTQSSKVAKRVIEKMMRSTYKFIPTDKIDHHGGPYRDYVIADFSKRSKAKFGLRWRSESDVLLGKGKTICGNTKCTANTKLSSFEVNFAYVERGRRKQALVKIKLCKRCSRLMDRGTSKQA